MSDNQSIVFILLIMFVSGTVQAVIDTFDTQPVECSQPVKDE